MQLCCLSAFCASREACVGPLMGHVGPTACILNMVAGLTDDVMRKRFEWVSDLRTSSHSLGLHTRFGLLHGPGSDVIACGPQALLCRCKGVSPGWWM